MKIRDVTIAIKPHEQVMKEFAIALGKARRGEAVEPHREVSFENLDTLRKFLTGKRLGLLHAIKQHQPESIYALAKILHRDLKNVNDDLKILEDLGLVSLQHQHEGREKVKPQLLSEKVQVEIAI